MGSHNSYGIIWINLHSIIDELPDSGDSQLSMNENMVNNEDKGKKEEGENVLED